MKKSIKKCIDLSAVIINGKEFYLGDSPTGFITKDGEMYDYDNQFIGAIDDSQKCIFVDEAGIQSEEMTVAEFFQSCQECIKEYETEIEPISARLRNGG